MQQDLFDFDERASIMEYDGHLSRADAEYMSRALAQTQGITLRPYQQDAVNAVMMALERGEHPVVNAATGGGKSLLIAAIAAQLPGRILVVTHRKKLLSQNSAQLAKYLHAQDADIGVYSAGLDQRDTHQRVIFGGVQSIYRRMDTLQQAGPFRYVLCDECHLVPPPNEQSMYAAVLLACPGAQLVGFSATPSRMGTPVYGDENAWFSRCAITIGIRELTPQYLAPLVEMQHAQDIDLSAIRIKAGEFVMADAGQVMSEEKVAEAALREVCLLAQQRKQWALFCCDIAHTRLVASLLQGMGIPCGVLASDQDNEMNDAALVAFEHGETRALASCIMMTTGFDIPGIDCITLLRPTMSRELLIQMLGRGTRKAEGKTDCLILDYAGNLERHQPLDEISEMQQTAARKKKDADAAEKAEKESREEKERAAKHRASLLHEHASAEELCVSKVFYKVVPGKKQPNSRLLQVQYLCEPHRWISQWLCVEYPPRSWPYRQAQAWFQRRGHAAVPYTADRAMSLAQRSAKPTTILVTKEGKWDRIVVERFD